MEPERKMRVVKIDNRIIGQDCYLCDDPAIVLERRKAKAFDAIASGSVYCKREYLSDGVWNVWCDGPGHEVVRCETPEAVLTAIEEAIKCDTQP